MILEMLKKVSRAAAPGKKAQCAGVTLLRPVQKTSFQRSGCRWSGEDRGLRFFFDGDFDLSGDVAEHLDGHLRFADDFDRFGKLHLALVRLESLRGEPLGNVGGRHGAE